MGTIHLFGDINNIGEEKFSLGILYIYIIDRQERAVVSRIIEMQIFPTSPRRRFLLNRGTYHDRTF